MKNKKGFTLIELLAVIVILAIIALIATPIILGIIKDARESANQRSAELYLEAVKLSVARRNLIGSLGDNLTCDIGSNGSLTCNGIEIDVDVTQKATGGTITFTDGMITAVEDLAIGERTYELINGVLVATGSSTPAVSYTITVNITNGSSTGATTIDEGGSATVTLSASSNYGLPAQSDITVGNATISSYSQTTGELVLASPTGNVTVSATCQQAGKQTIVVDDTTYYIDKLVRHTEEEASFPQVSDIGIDIAHADMVNNYENLNWNYNSENDEYIATLNSNVATGNPDRMAMCDNVDQMDGYPSIERNGKTYYYAG